MPYIHLSTDRTIAEDSKQALTRRIVSYMQEYLQKPPERCMIHLSGNEYMAKGDGVTGCAFVQVLIKGQADVQKADAFGARIKADLARTLDIAPENVYVCLQEMTDGPFASRIL